MIDPCLICSRLKDVETSFYKYAAPEHDHPRPSAGALCRVCQALPMSGESFIAVNTAYLSDYLDRLAGEL